MTTVLITGANGQVGSELQRLPWDDAFTVIALDSAALDITDQSSVISLFAEHEPDVVLNAAAYTAVDAAETNEDRATAVNATGVGFLAEASNAHQALLVHLSTDYVFDGTKDGWYVEDDPTDPASAYGRSKLAGEAAALRADRSVVLRTSWVYSATGKNFVKTIRRLGGERSELSIIDDQHGCPTAASAIATAIATLVSATTGGATVPPNRLYHLAAPDHTSWHGFAEAILRESNLNHVACNPIPSSEYPVAAERPKNSKLDSGLLARDLGIVLPSWRQSLHQVVAELDAG